jgi:hypothetical protein
MVLRMISSGCSTSLFNGIDDNNSEINLRIYLDVHRARAIRRQLSDNVVARLVVGMNRSDNLMRKPIAADTGIYNRRNTDQPGADSEA